MKYNKNYNNPTTNSENINNNNSYDPRSESCINVSSLVRSRRQTLIIFDWDDTILSSTWLHRNNLSLQPSSKLLPYHETELERLSQCVLQTLTLSMHFGMVILVTNAEEGWVEMSGRKFLPDVIDFIYRNKIKVVSARSVYQPQGYTLRQWKREAFIREIFAHFPAARTQSKENFALVNLQQYLEKHHTINGKIQNPFHNNNGNNAILIANQAQNNNNNACMNNENRIIIIHTNNNNNNNNNNINNINVNFNHAQNYNACINDNNVIIVDHAENKNACMKNDNSSINDNSGMDLDQGDSMLDSGFSTRTSTLLDYAASDEINNNNNNEGSSSVDSPVFRVNYEDDYCSFLDMSPDIFDGFEDIDAETRNFMKYYCGCMMKKRAVFPVAEELIPDLNLTVLSVGDSSHERDAVLSLVKTSLPVHFKTIKFADRPALDQLINAHVAYRTSLPEVLFHPGFLDLAVDVDNTAGHAQLQQEDEQCYNNNDNESSNYYHYYQQQHAHDHAVA